MNHPRIIPRVSLHRPGFDVLTLLCAVLIVIQVMVEVSGGVMAHISGGLYETFGLSRPGISSGRVWQLFTHPFLHGSWMHLLLNGLMIFLMGGRVFHILGGRAFAKIFFGGVLAGGLLHVLLQPRFPLGEDGSMIADAPLVGASAGAIALLLALIILSPDSRMWPFMISGRNLGRGLLVATVILFVLTPGLNIPVLSAVGLWLTEKAGLEALFDISHICHFGGGLVGMVYARRLLHSPVSLEQLRRARKRREGIAA